MSGTLIDIDIENTSECKGKSLTELVKLYAEKIEQHLDDEAHHILLYIGKSFSAKEDFNNNY